MQIFQKLVKKRISKIIPSFLAYNQLLVCSVRKKPYFFKFKTRSRAPCRVNSGSRSCFTIHSWSIDMWIRLWRLASGHYPVTVLRTSFFVSWELFFTLTLERSCIYVWYWFVPNIETNLILNVYELSLSW